MITRHELIRKYIEFFKKKNHKEIPSASLIPSNDPTVLFTTAGMQPLVPYLTGQKHPLGKRLVDVQKCLRTDDIEEVGDTTHHTFFEMLGNWSLNDYWKKESIEWSFEFLTQILKIPIEKLAITCFAGDKDAPKDEESAKIWYSLGISKDRLAFLPKKDNWWGPAGQTGPCGPDTEIFYWTGSTKAPKTYNPEDKHWVEIWNNVFMEYEKTSESKYLKAKQQNVDTGMGVERTLAALNNLKDNYEGPSFSPIIKEIEKISDKNYESAKKEMRIIADHIRSAVFILSEENMIKPSNSLQGYVLRRLIRRAVRYALLLEVKENFTTKIANIVIESYQDYPELKKNKSYILTQLEDEENKFRKTLENGIKMFDKISTKAIDAKTAFLLYQSHGFPIEMTVEIAKEKNMKVDSQGFYEELKKHQELSRSTSSGMFKSGLADSSEQTTRLHTATHLLNEALREVLGENVRQRGSNITPERLRFDFNFDRKLTPEEINQVEDLVNKKIKESLVVTREETSLKKALEEGAQGEFGHKYPEKVSVYTISDKSKKGWYSKEICTGPHVKNTKEIGKFQITKEESVSAGVRRIKAIIT